jgi:hypothetical protein
MIKRMFILFGCCFLYTAVKAQHPDTLVSIKNYLQFMRNNINTHEKTNKIKVSVYDSLIRLGTAREEQLKTSLASLQHQSDTEYPEMIKSFHFIMQSLVILKMDLKQNNYEHNENSRNEVIYLNKNIPVLIDKIYYFLEIERKLKLSNTN